MQIFLKYLQNHLLGLLLPPIWALFLFTIFWLYQLPLFTLFYALLVCLLISLLFIAVDYWRWRRLHLSMQGLGVVLQVDYHQLPPPKNLLEQDWHYIFMEVCDYKQQQLETMQAVCSNMTDYFTVWGHQIKTPLAALRLQLQGEPLEQVQEIESYVEMLLTYLHLEAKASDYVIRQTDLDDVVQQAVRHFAPQFIRRHLRLNYQPFGVSALTDARWLLFVLEQVLANALKYTPDVAPPQENTITISLEPPLTLCVADTGIGIAPEDLARIFDQGYTGQNGRALDTVSLPGQQKASGLGLYLCQRICANLGHRIWAHSVLDEGTVIKIDLASRPQIWE